VVQEKGKKKEKGRKLIRSMKNKKMKKNIFHFHLSTRESQPVLDTVTGTRTPHPFVILKKEEKKYVPKH